MSYDRFGRTPEMARKERIQDWLVILALMLMIACIVMCAMLVVMILNA